MTVNEEHDAGRAQGLVRLAIGYVQGLAAWLLIEAARTGPAHAQTFASAHPQAFAALAMVAAFPPLIVLAGIGRMRPLVLAIWTAAAAAILAGLGAYDLWREPVGAYGRVPRFWPSTQLVFFGAAAIYIVHHLIEPADLERSLRPSYRLRFESAWRHAFQLALSLAFTVVFWAVLQLGAALFDMIGVKAISQLVRQTWFHAPATGLAFAAAVHLTDVRPGLIRGVRTVGLTLLAWLLPLLAGLAAAFLVALVFTGVQPLWATRRATALLLSAAAALIVLINAAYQDGETRESLPAALRWAARGAALLTTPLVALSAWAVALRIGQYGLTPERVVSVAALAAAAVYAAGYGWAAVAKGPWLARIEPVNVVGAVVSAGLILLLLSPLADPARLSVDDQMARLAARKTPLAQFDFKFLRFNAGRFGRDALTRLAASRDGAVATQARAAQAWTTPYLAANTSGPPMSHATLRTIGAKLPDSFRRQVFNVSEIGQAACLVSDKSCDVYLLDVTGDGSPEVLAKAPDARGMDVYAGGPGGRWRLIGDYTPEACGQDWAKLQARLGDSLQNSQARPVAPAAQDLDVGGVRLNFSANQRCMSSEAVRVDLVRPAGARNASGPDKH